MHAPLRPVIIVLVTTTTTTTTEPTPVTVTRILGEGSRRKGHVYVGVTADEKSLTAIYQGKEGAGEKWFVVALGDGSYRYGWDWRGYAGATFEDLVRSYAR